MNVASGAALVTALFSALGVCWTIYSQLRERRGAVQVQRASQALALMEEIGLGGMDRVSDEHEMQALHDLQVHRLQRVIRLNTAAFVARSAEPIITLWSLGLMFLYSVALYVLGSISLYAGGVSSSERVGNLVLGGILVLLATGIFFATLIRLTKRLNLIQQHKAAGVDPKRMAINVRLLLRVSITDAVLRWRQRRDLNRQ